MQKTKNKTQKCKNHELRFFYVLEGGNFCDDSLQACFMALLQRKHFALVYRSSPCGNMKILILYLKAFRCYVAAYVLRKTFDQATMSHGLNAQQVDNLSHCHILFGNMTDPWDVALT